MYNLISFQNQEIFSDVMMQVSHM